MSSALSVPTPQAPGMVSQHNVIMSPGMAFPGSARSAINAFGRAHYCHRRVGTNTAWPGREIAPAKPGLSSFCPPTHRRPSPLLAASNYAPHIRSVHPLEPFLNPFIPPTVFPLSLSLRDSNSSSIDLGSHRTLVSQQGYSFSFFYSLLACILPSPSIRDDQKPQGLRTVCQYVVRYCTYRFLSMPSSSAREA